MDEKKGQMKVAVLGNKELLRKYIIYSNRANRVGVLHYQFNNILKENYEDIKKNDIVIILAADDMEADTLLCKSCRRITNNPIIILGKPDETYEIRMLEAGADDYIKTPITKKILDTLIYTHLRREYRHALPESKGE